MSNQPTILQHGITFAILPPSSSLKICIVPAEMSTPEQIQSDMTLSANIINRLDELTGVSASTTQAVLNFEGSPEKKLDVQILYLRRVHYFSFYTTEWCGNEWDLTARCGSMHVRGHSQIDTKFGSSSEFVQMHNKRTAEFLAKLDLERPDVLKSYTEPIQNSMSHILAESSLQLEDAKYKCRRCSKLFKGKEYVRKHLAKAHPDLYAGVLSAVCADEAYKLFAASSSGSE